MLETESILHGDLQARGYRLYLEPAAKTKHVSISLLSSYLGASFSWRAYVRCKSRTDRKVVHFSAAALYLWHATLSIRASKACSATYISVGPST